MQKVVKEAKNTASKVAELRGATANILQTLLKDSLNDLSERLNNLEHIHLWKKTQAGHSVNEEEVKRALAQAAVSLNSLWDATAAAKAVVPKKSDN